MDWLVLPDSQSFSLSYCISIAREYAQIIYTIAVLPIKFSGFRKKVFEVIGIRPSVISLRLSVFMDRLISQILAMADGGEKTAQFLRLFLMAGG